MTERKLRGFVCPDCGSMTRREDSRPLEQFRKRRIRKCSCGYRCTTIEKMEKRFDRKSPPAGSLENKFPAGGDLDA